MKIDSENGSKQLHSSCRSPINCHRHYFPCCIIASANNICIESITCALLHRLSRLWRPTARNCEVGPKPALVLSPSKPKGALCGHTAVSVRRMSEHGCKAKEETNQQGGKKSLPTTDIYNPPLSPRGFCWSSQVSAFRIK